MFIATGLATFIKNNLAKVDSEASLIRRLKATAIDVMTLTTR
jgi:hypothetical protein